MVTVKSLSVALLEVLTSVAPGLGVIVGFTSGIISGFEASGVASLEEAAVVGLHFLFERHVPVTLSMACCKAGRFTLMFLKVDNIRF